MFKKFYFRMRYLILFFCAVFTLSNSYLEAQKKDFVVVLDAGHGGRDPGAVGRISKEKDINLSVVRMLGDLIEKNLPDVKVKYTRKTDVFIPLEDRAAVANNNHADMFISIHVNAAKSKSAYGAETYTLGLAKTKSNLDVAMTENSVILLEDDYQTKYLGFDPSSVDSYIMFEFMMDKYLDNSIAFATHIQNQFTGAAKRYDRGVRQAGFWVLHRSACPSVLIELGFISNYTEELYLASTGGQRELAQAIYDAFVKYKQSHDRKLGYANNNNNNNNDNALNENVAGNQSDRSAVAEMNTSQTSSSSSSSSSSVMQQVPVFKIQIQASATPIKLNDASFKGLKNVTFYKEGGLFKYTVGTETDYSKINKMRREIAAKFPDAFVIAFVGEQKISVAEALKIIK